MSVVLKCPRAITKAKSMLDDYKRNVLPGAAYSNITFLLTTIRGKNYISHLKRTTIRVLTSHVASPPRSQYPFACLVKLKRET